MVAVPSTGRGPATSALGAKLRRLIDDALASYAGTSEEVVLRDLQARLDEPLRVAIVGRLKAGKSTLLNAVLGERAAATDATECTRIVTWYVHGVTSRAWAHPRDGEPRQVRYLREAGETSIDLGELVPEDLERLSIEMPNSQLEQLTLIDTPGLGSLSEDVSKRTTDFVEGSQRGADAVVYLMRQVHASDVAFLDAFQQDEFRGTSPVNAIGVLSRADEIGAGRGDALALADQVSSLYRYDTRMRRLVQTVLPVAGLLAQAGAVLTEHEYAALVALTDEPADRLSSADLLLGAESAVPRADRELLLDGLGLFGVRLAVTLVRTGRARDAGELAAELRRRSGLDELRDALLDLFALRADSLKAQVGLQQLETIVQRTPVPDSGVLTRRMEELVVGAHELTELRLLNELRAGDVDLDDPERLEAAEGLLGAHGSAITKRLRLPDSADPAEITEAVRSELRAWQRLSVSPIASASQKRVAGVLRRTCEGLLRQ